MAISKIEIEKLARLARLELSAEEKEKFAEQISSILEYVGQVEEVDTRKVASGENLTLEKITRQDIRSEYQEAEKIIKQFPERAGNLNKTRSIIE